MKYDFDQVVERRGTDCIKWSLYPDDVIPMWVADTDFRSPQPVIQALHRRVDHGVFGYSQPAADLRNAIQERLKKLYRWEIRTDEILFLPGIVTGLNIAFQAFVRPQEGVLAQPPVYFHFLRDPVHRGRVVSDPPLVRNGNTYEVDFDRFEKAISANTRIFVLCNPHNPVGRVFTRTELERMAEICLRHRLLICSDEIHCDLVYSGHRHIPIASLSPEIAASTVTLMAPSKTYNVAGLECGYAIIRNPELLRTWRDTSYALIPGVNIMGHVAALAALRDGQDWLDQIMAYLESNRDYLAAQLRERMPFIKMCRTEATYLAWLDCKDAGIPGNPAEFFLKQARVGLNDGPEFGNGGEGFVRLNFGCPRRTLVEALERMTVALNRLHRI